MTTGLVTLSVHDSLTFEGVEIAINPALFTTGGGNTVSVSGHGHGHGHGHGRHTRDSSFSSVILSPVPPPSPMIGTPVPGQNQDDAYSLRSNMETPPSQGGYSPKININASIQAGDIIEIKVWDKKPNQPQSSKNTGLNGNGNGNKTSHDHVLANAASKLQQQISLQSSFPSVLHPLSDPNRDRDRGNNNHKVSLRPPMAPRGTSTASAAGSLNSSPHHVANANSPTTAAPPKVNIFRRDVNPDSDNSNNTSSITSSWPAPPSLIRPRLSSDGTTTPLDGNETMQKRRERMNSTNQTPPASNITASAVSDMEVLDLDRNSGGVDHQGLSVIEHPGVTKGSEEMGNRHITESGHHSRISSLGSSASNGSATCDDAPGIQEDDVIEQISRTHTMRMNFVAAVTEKSLSALKAGGRTQISILRQVADLYELSSYDELTITKFDKSEEERVQASVQADYVTMTIKDQFISRGEMYQFQNTLIGKWIYAGERLSTSDGIRGTVNCIRRGNEEFRSAFITEDTKITCRSRSARIIWLVQISSEMWDYASPYEAGGDGACEIYFDKFVSFMYR